MIIGGTIAFISFGTWIKIQDNLKEKAFDKKVKLCLMLSDSDTYFGKSWCEAPTYEAAVKKGDNFCSNKDTHVFYAGCGGQYQKFINKFDDRK